MIDPAARAPGAAPAVRPVACPACMAPMRALVLERKPLGTVQIDLCSDCRVLWFDAFESVQLTPGAVIELFRAIEAAPQEARKALTARLACPRCTEPLALTHDQTISGAFTYYRCTRGHGRLTPFVQFLREKAFIKPLSPAALARLKAQVQVIRCASCGAPVDLEQHAVCPWCRSPIVALDPDSVGQALAEYRDAEAKRTSIDPDALVAALALPARTADSVSGSRDVSGLDLVELGLRALAKVLGPPG